MLTFYIYGNVNQMVSSWVELISLVLLLLLILKLQITYQLICALSLSIATVPSIVM